MFVNPKTMHKQHGEHKKKRTGQTANECAVSVASGNIYAKLGVFSAVLRRSGPGPTDSCVHALIIRCQRDMFYAPSQESAHALAPMRSIASAHFTVLSRAMAFFFCGCGVGGDDDDRRSTISFGLNVCRSSGTIVNDFIC